MQSEGTKNDVTIGIKKPQLGPSTNHEQIAIKSQDYNSL